MSLASTQARTGFGAGQLAVPQGDDAVDDHVIDAIGAERVGAPATPRSGPGTTIRAGTAAGVYRLAEQW